MTLNDTFERRGLFQTRVHAWDDVVAVQGRRLDLRAGHVTVEPALAARGGGRARDRRALRRCRGVFPLPRGPLGAVAGGQRVARHRDESQRV